MKADSGSIHTLVSTKVSQFAADSPSPWLLLILAPLVAVQWLATQASIDLTWPLVPLAGKKFSWAYGYLTHIMQALVALGLIALLRPWFPSKFGLQLPPERSYIGPALLLGSLAGPIMLVVDYLPNLLSHSVPSGPYSIAPSNMLPWLAMQGIFVGLSEEVVFRGLFVGYLLTLYPRRISLLGLDVSLAGTLCAVVFALAHADSFMHEPFAAALGQQIYVIALGVFYAWLMEKSGSILAPAIAHNAGDLLEWGACFALQALWGPH
jgi:membrane protease YdiL (CAAX protease family)